MSIYTDFTFKINFSVFYIIFFTDVIVKSTFRYIYKYIIYEIFEIEKDFQKDLTN